MPAETELSPIFEHIKNELNRIESSSSTKGHILYKICYSLHENFQKLIRAVDSHLLLIQTQMPDYDKHDASHSKHVLQLIEKLLCPERIRQMPFLEAELLALCCHFHDTGMAVPEWCFDLLKKVEEPNYTWHNSSDEIIKAMRQPDSGWVPAKPYSEVQSLFLVPQEEPDFYEWLAEEVMKYEEHRQHLEPWNGTETRDKWVLRTREDYMRASHGKRSQDYAKCIGKTLDSLCEYDVVKRQIAEAVGMICYAHTQPMDAVWECDKQGIVRLMPGVSDDALSFNPAFIAMLLRLGDVLDFCRHRASTTLYNEKNPMGKISKMHWQTKICTGLEVEINSTDNDSKQILYMGNFKEPKDYYFFLRYLDGVDEELKNYADFVQEMERRYKQDRYDLSLPQKVDRSGVNADLFTPDPELKISMEDSTIILRLLMDLKLYSGSFACLRELYQNALDASHCMKAENHAQKLDGPLPIEFGLETDEKSKRTFLYCRDSGIGMTEKDIKTYLLRVGNSFYRSAEFRRENAKWRNEVQPISEFGIGLLSCYMIGDRIEILTRSYKSDDILWVCMDDADSCGYFRKATKMLERRIGNHGTEIRVFLKNEFIQGLTTKLPESQEAAENIIFLRRSETSYFSNVDNANYLNSLWYRLQSVICVPEVDHPVRVYGENNQFCELKSTHVRFPLESRIEQIGEYLNVGNQSDIQESVSNAKFIPISFTDETTGSEARTCLYLPVTDEMSVEPDEVFFKSIGSPFSVDGMAVDAKIDNYGLAKHVCWNWKGSGRPTLSVNRERVNDMPKSFFATEKRLLTGLYKEINHAISKHFKEYPNANTDQVRSNLLAFLSRSLRGSLFSNSSRLIDLWRELSSDIFGNHMEKGLPMAALRGTPCQFSIKVSDLPSIRSNPYRMEIAFDILSRARSVQLRANEVVVETTDCPATEDNLLHNPAQFRCRADSMENCWGNIDVQTDLLPFVSPNLFQRLEGCKLGNGFVKMASIHHVTEYYSLFTQEDGGTIPERVLQQLRAKQYFLGENTDLCSVDVSAGAPLLYVFITPATPSENTEKAIESCKAVPGFVKGIREGWSLLLYPEHPDVGMYCYVLAPGVVDRFEMAKHIPQEIVAEAVKSGHPLHFTDGTTAFPI